jgi:hypothetical protein
MTKITAVTIRDIRFPTSRNLDGSDAMNPDPDYSAAYVVLKTDKPGLEGHGLTFTLGLGTELCVAAAVALSQAVIGRDLADITGDMGKFWRGLTEFRQLRWVGPEKGVLHLATAAVVLGTGVTTADQAYLSRGYAMIRTGATPSGQIKIRAFGETPSSLLTIKAGSFFRYRVIS